MCRVTTNVALNKRRGKRRELEVSLEEHLPTYLEDGHRAGDRSYVLADWSSTPEQTYLSAEARKILENAIDGLPDHCRAVLILRDVEGLSSQGVAAIVDDSLGSVKSRLHRARMVLREQLTATWGHGRDLRRGNLASVHRHRKPDGSGDTLRTSAPRGGNAPPSLLGLSPAHPLG
jgi:RNA polymerase sigma-70 factor (ECF subfamily)